jgi:hypothetical protein
MGGIGSGNRYRYGAKSTVEGRTSLDINRWARVGNLTAGRSFTWQWTWGDGSKSSINVRVESAWTIRLIYRTRSGGEEDWTDVDYSIQLTRTPCRFGGERTWFVCLGRGCGRRVAKLYCVGRYYVCRHCGNLAYSSQREDVGDRALSRAQAIRKRLGGSANMFELFPSKPKGMHWRTYTRLQLKSLRLGELSCIHMAEKFGMLERMLEKIDTKFL